MHDVIIIGGAYAGLAAALQLARARRTVLVIDAGERRNRFVQHAHGFLTRDGQSPAAIAALGRQDVARYPSVTFLDASADAVRAIPGGFAVRVGDEEHQARRLILATGVADELPAVAGLAERWGKSAYSCPYCDGYERELGALGILATGPQSIHHAILVAQWAGRATFFLNDAFEPDAEQRAALAARDIAVERTPVVRVSGDAPRIDIHLRDGRTVATDGLFVATRAVIRDRFAEQLGCELETGPMGSYYKTDPQKETTVPGVYACGDVGSQAPAVAFAVADGTRAGIAAHQSLVFRG